jgi:hypothetical protein
MGMIVEGKRVRGKMEQLLERVGMGNRPTPPLPREGGWRRQGVMHSYKHELGEEEQGGPSPGASPEDLESESHERTVLNLTYDRFSCLRYQINPLTAIMLIAQEVI